MWSFSVLSAALTLCSLQSVALSFSLQNDLLTAAAGRHEFGTGVSPFLGTIRRIRMPGQDSFVGAMSVPTFSAVSASTSLPNAEINDETKPELLVDLSETLKQGPAFCLRNALSLDACQDIIETCESLGFGLFHAGKNHHGALQIVVSEAICSQLASSLEPWIDLQQVRGLAKEMTGDSMKNPLQFVGVNRRWRVYRYEPGGQQTFAPHIDAGFPPSSLTPNGSELVWDSSNGSIVSRLTLLLYLNEDFVGGETNFYKPTSGSSGALDVIASVRPVAGSCLVFPQAVGEDAVEYARQHWPLHEGSSVESGARPKYVIRSDILFAERA